MKIISTLIFGSRLEDNCFPKWPAEEKRLGITIVKENMLLL